MTMTSWGPPTYCRDAAGYASPANYYWWSGSAHRIGVDSVALQLHDVERAHERVSAFDEPSIYRGSSSLLGGCQQDIAHVPLGMIGAPTLWMVHDHEDPDQMSCHLEGKSIDAVVLQ